MFTGIIEEVGRVRHIRMSSAGAEICILATSVLDGCRLGDSIAVNGVCLTVREMDNVSFTADVMPETVRRTSLGALRPGSAVNLERAMSASGRFGGHIVSGHVDCCGKVVSMKREDNAIIMKVSVDQDLLRYIPVKGSITLDGISLTVTESSSGTVAVSLIPHTVASTRLKHVAPGDPINVEVDLMARYAARLLGADGGRESHESGITLEFLAENGF